MSQTIFLKAVFRNGKKQLAEFTIDVNPEAFRCGVLNQYDETDGIVSLEFCSEMEYLSYNLCQRGLFLHNRQREILETGKIEVIKPNTLLLGLNF